MPFLPTINVPGCLPDDAEPWPIFETAAEAWKYLADRRREFEDDLDDPLVPYSPTVGILDAYAYASAGHRPHTVWGPTGRDHDLGLIYEVTEVGLGPHDWEYFLGWFTGEPSRRCALCGTHEIAWDDDDEPESCPQNIRPKEVVRP